MLRRVLELYLLSTRSTWLPFYRSLSTLLMLASWVCFTIAVTLFAWSSSPSQALPTSVVTTVVAIIAASGLEIPVMANLLGFKPKWLIAKVEKTGAAIQKNAIGFSVEQRAAEP